MYFCFPFTTKQSTQNRQEFPFTKLLLIVATSILYVCKLSIFNNREVIKTPSIFTTNINHIYITTSFQNSTCTASDAYLSAAMDTCFTSSRTAQTRSQINSFARMLIDTYQNSTIKSVGYY